MLDQHRFTMSKSCGDAECVCAGKSADEISRMFKRGGVAEKALFLASKVPVTVDTVGEDINQAVILINQVQTGMAEIGAGATGKKMKETGHPYVPGTNYAQKLYMPIVFDDHVLTADEVERPDAFRHFANTTKMGCLVLAGDPKNFQRWAMHQQAKEEISKIAPGRLWAYVKPSMAAADAPGHIISVDAINATASSTVSNGKGVIAWASGNYYEGDLKNSKMHGIGGFFWANGTTYKGQMENSDFNGLGTKTFASGKKEKGVWKDDKFVKAQEFAVDSNGYPVIS